MDINAVVNPNIDMPACLLYRPLTFGDREQIEAIERIEKLLSLTQKQRDEGLEIYEVTIEKTIEYTTVVAASSKEEAIMIAEEEDHFHASDVTGEAKVIDMEAA